MCGIVGILNLRPGAPRLEAALLTGMRDAMVHRGPDSGGIWISENQTVGLAHRRLKIIDLSDAAQQPMCNEDGTLWIVFNGEIYNHLDLKPELEKEGHRFKSHSDTEVILHAYEQWGTSAIERLEGMFAFALWDQTQNQLWLARDRMGKKPLYFTEVGDQFLFASEIKSLLKHPRVSRQHHEEALWHYLTFAVAPAPLTLFKNIYKLPPATHLLLSPEKPWTFVEYWQPWAPTDSPPQKFEDYAEEIRIELKAAVNRRLMSDVPFGVFLSGGVDSSANVAFMSQSMNRPVDTFSVGFEDAAQSPYDEIQYARKISKLFGTNHHEILISDRHFFDFVDRLAFYQDEPLCDPVCFPLYYVSKLARDHGTIVIQVGEGSDEAFAGYEIYQNYLKRNQGYWGQFQKMPRFLQKWTTLAASPFLDSRSHAHLKRASEGDPAFVSAALAFYDIEKHNLRDWTSFEKSSQWAALAYEGVNPSFQCLKRLLSNASIQTKPAPELSSHDFLKKMIYWECHQRLGELLLMRLDKMTMAHSVEGRAPFLDRKIVELAMKIPSDYKIRGGIGKAVLKKAVERDLPQEWVYRKKVGFCGGSGNMLTPGILKYAQSQIEKTLPDYGWNSRAIQTLFQEHQRGKAENSFQIWNLMNLSLWFKQWMT